MAKSRRNATSVEIAEIFDVDSNIPPRWAKEGCPHKRVGKLFKFDEAEVAHWLQANNRTGKPGRPRSVASDNLDGARLRKENALASKYELQVSRDRGELLDAEEVERGRVERVTAVRSRLMGVGASLAPRLVGLEAAEIQEEIDAAMRDICGEFARS